MHPTTSRNQPSQSSLLPREFAVRMRLSVAVFALSTLCFAAGFVLGIFGRAGLTQFVSAGSFLALLASRVGTGKGDDSLLKTSIQKLTGLR